MPLTLFIATNTLPREQSTHGEITEILNERLAGARNVAGTLRWLKSGESFTADAGQRHQLLYVMEGSGSISLERQSHDVSRGMGAYLGPAETATIQAAPGGTLKVFHLVVPQIPR